MVPVVFQQPREPTTAGTPDAGGRGGSSETLGQGAQAADNHVGARDVAEGGRRTGETRRVGGNPGRRGRRALLHELSNYSPAARGIRSASAACRRGRHFGNPDGYSLVPVRR